MYKLDYLRSVHVYVLLFFLILVGTEIGESYGG